MSVKKNYFYNGILLVSQYIIPLFIFPYISRVLGINKIGVVNWIDGTLNYFVMFSMLGLTLTGIRETAKYKNNRKKLDQVFSELLIIHIITTLIIGIVYIVIILNYFKFREYKLLFFIGIPKLIFSIFLIEWFYRGIENFKFITIRSIIIKLVYVAAVYIFVQKEEDYIIYFFFTCLITVINALVNCLYARKFITFTLKGLQIKRHLAPFLTIGVYCILTTMYTTFNLTYLGIVASSKAVGSYSTALKLYTIILGGFSALNTVLISRLSSLLSENKVENFNRLIEKSLIFVTTFCFPVIICLTVLAPQIIYILAGPGYEDAILCFRIIIPLILIVGLAQIFSHQVLMSLKKDKAIAYTSFIGAFIGITLNIILVPRYAQVGTSFVVLISEVFVTLSLYAQCYKYVKLKLPGSTIISNVLVSPMYIFICYFSKNIFSNHVVILLVSSISSLIYFLFSQIYLVKNKLILSEIDKLRDRLVLNKTIFFSGNS